LKADIIITATGLDLLAFGGSKFNWIRNFDISKSFVYKGLMLSDLPFFILLAIPMHHGR
jgi:cation diffusion facilitator CzcD-associated flavoprotein CzcO